MWTVHRLELEGSDVQLFCRAGGFPAPKVTWYDRDNQPIDNKDPQYLVSEDSYIWRSCKIAKLWAQSIRVVHAAYGPACRVPLTDGPACRVLRSWWTRMSGPMELMDPHVGSYGADEPACRVPCTELMDPHFGSYGAGEPACRVSCTELMDPHVGSYGADEPACRVPCTELMDPHVGSHGTDGPACRVPCTELWTRACRVGPACRVPRSWWTRQSGLTERINPPVGYTRLLSSTEQMDRGSYVQCRLQMDPPRRSVPTERTDPTEQIGKIGSRIPVL